SASQADNASSILVTRSTRRPRPGRESRAWALTVPRQLLISRAINVQLACRDQNPRCAVVIVPAVLGPDVGVDRVRDPLVRAAPRAGRSASRATVGCSALSQSGCSQGYTH